MNKTNLIFRHEFLTTLRRTGFIIMTLIVPLIAVLAIVISQIISGATHPSVQITNIGYIDEVGGFDQFTQQGNVKLVPYTAKDEAVQALVDNKIKEYIIITPDYFRTGLINLYTLEKQLVPPPEVIAGIKDFVSSNILTGKLPDNTIALINAPLNLVSTRITETGAIAPEQGGLANLLIPSLFGLLLVLSITFSSTYLLQGLSDEKENRLIEILLSSVSTRQLITGKVLGLGAAGLAQVMVWVISAPLIVNLASSSIGGFFSNLQISAGFLFLIIVYFILGYLIFAVVFTAIGSITSSFREGQQFSTIFTLLGVCPLWFSSALILFPNNPVFVFMTIFPFTAPVTVMIRFGVTAVPVWEIVLSIAVMLLSIVGGLLLTVRIVRVFLLMYGKRPNLATIIRSVKAG